jgi:hypothetical protein
VLSWNINTFQIKIKKNTKNIEMPVPSQGHYGFHSFPVVDWFCLFIYLWVLTFLLEDCSEFGNFVITLISSTNKTDHHDITEILLKVVLNTINHIFYILNFQQYLGYIMEVGNNKNTKLWTIFQKESQNS